MKFFKKKSGYTLVELMLVVVIIGILISIASPRLDLVLVQAHESRGKSTLGDLRTLIHLYYTENEGYWPLASEPTGTAHTGKGLSLYDMLIPRFQNRLITLSTKDRNMNVNGVIQTYDIQYVVNMAKTPPEDVQIDLNPPSAIAGVVRPFLYNNHTGHIYIANDNFDRNSQPYYFW